MRSIKLITWWSQAWQQLTYWCVNAVQMGQDEVSGANIFLICHLPDSKGEHRQKKREIPFKIKAPSYKTRMYWAWCPITWKKNYLHIQVREKKFGSASNGVPSLLFSSHTWNKMLRAFSFPPTKNKTSSGKLTHLPTKQCSLPDILQTTFWNGWQRGRKSLNFKQRDCYYYCHNTPPPPPNMMRKPEHREAHTWSCRWERNWF